MHVGSLGGKDPLEEGMPTYSRILAWQIPWTEEPGRLQSMGHKESDMTEHTHSSIAVGICTVSGLEAYRTINTL